MSKSFWAITVAVAFAFTMPLAAQAAQPLACLTGTDPTVTGDADDIYAVISLIESACPCAEFDGSKGNAKADYGKCVAAIVAQATAPPLPSLRSECGKTVQKIFKQATCGHDPLENSEPCISKSVNSGKIKCAIKPTTEKDGVTATNDCTSSGSTTRVSCTGFDLCLRAADTNLDALLAAPGDDGACPEPAEPACTDATMNGSETDTDCGGSCAMAPTNQLCSAGQGCAIDEDCTTGHCDGTVCVYATQGSACTSHDHCGAAGSNLCVDGVCCDTSCGSTCQACSAAKKGGGADGTCGSIAVNTDPDDDCAGELASSCGNTGSCDGAGACQKWAAGTTCRSAIAGVCDVAETCPGGGAACPADAFMPNTTLCRPASGVCDVAESCPGTAATCPANGFRPSTFAPPFLQTSGDCQKIVCTGSSATNVTSADDVIDIPTSNSACLVSPACDTSGGPATPYFQPAPTGTSCVADGGPGSVCGETSNPLVAGTCVECNTSADCGPTSPTCNTTTFVCE